MAQALSTPHNNFSQIQKKVGNNWKSGLKNNFFVKIEKVGVILIRFVLSSSFQ